MTSGPTTVDRAPSPVRTPGIVAALACVGLLWVAFVAVRWTPSSAFTSDEGAYAIQVRAVQAGSWIVDPGIAEVPGADAFPYVNSVEGDDGWSTYVQHPLFVRVLHASVSLLGERYGLLLPGLAGLLAAAAATVAIADRLGGRPAAWWSLVLAATSPLVVHAGIVWAHAPAAAAAGGATWAALRFREAGRPADALVMAAALIGAVLLRSEALLYGAALLVATVAWELRARADARRIAALAIVGAAVVAARVVEVWWIRSLVGGEVALAEDRSGGEGWVAGRLAGAWHSLVDGSYRGDAVGLLPVIGVVGFAVAVVQLARGRLGPTPVVVTGVVAATLLVVRVAVEPTDPVTGLLAAWPIAIVAVVPLLGRADRPSRFLGAVVLLYTAAVLLTQYAGGGGFEWGGRFLALQLPVLAALAGRVAAEWWARGQRELVAVVAVLCLAGLVAGLWTLVAVRDRNDRVLDAIESADPTVVVTTEPALPRIGWRLHGDVPYVLVDDDEVEEAVEALVDRGVERLVAVGASPVGAEVDARPVAPGIVLLSRP